MEPSRPELIRVMKAVMLAAFPFLKRPLLPMRGRIVAVYAGAGRCGTNGVYTVDVQPLDAAGQPTGSVLPHLPVPTVWVGPGRGIFAVPPVGALARVGWYDTGEPYLDAVLPDGFEAPAQKAGALVIVHPSGEIRITPDGGVWITSSEGIILDTDQVMIMKDLVVGGTIHNL